MHSSSFARRALVLSLVSSLLFSILQVAPSAAQTEDVGRVEIVTARTENAKFFDNLNGTFTAEYSTGPVHYVAGDGSWQEIDPSLIPTTREGYAFQNAQGPFSVYFAARADPAAMVRIEDANGSLTFGLEDASDASIPIVQGSSITYPEVRPGMDIVYEVSNGAVKELIVLKAAPQEPLTLDFPLALSGLTIEDDQAPGLELVGTAGAAFKIPALWMQDSSDLGGGEGAFSEAVALDVSGTGGNLALSVTPDTAWLNDPARVYPVVVDPSTEKITTLDTYVQSDIINTPQDTKSELKSGTFNSGSTKARSLFKFANVENDLAGKTIDDADFKIYENHSFSCSASQVEVYRVISSWSSSVLWSNQPSVAGTPASWLNVAKGFSSSCPADHIFFDVTSPVRGWVNGSWSNYGLEIRAASETNSNGWKKFAPAETSFNPKLVITYSVPDTTGPGAPSVTSNTHPSQSTWYPNDDPSFDFSASDPSGIAGYSYVIDQNSSTTPDVTLDTTSNGASASNLADGEWWIHVRAKDGAGNWGTTSAVTHFKVRIDDTAPPQPSASSSTHAPGATCVANSSPAFSWNAVSDTSGITGYSYTLDAGSGTNPDNLVDTTGTSRSYSGLADGNHWFHLKAINGASLGSSTHHYPISIDTTAPSVNLSSSTHSSENTWYVSDDPSFSWSSFDPAGISGYSYTLDHNASTTPDTASEGTGTSVTYSNLADGEWYLHVRALDGCGKWGATTHRRVRIDDSPAALTSLTSSTHPDQNLWTVNNDPSFSWSASDTSGISGYSYVLDNSSGTTPDTVIDTSGTSRSYGDLADGEWWFHVRAQNGSGLWGSSLHYRVRIDIAGPGATSITSSTHASANTWYASDDVSLAWTASDPSGISGYSYVLDQSSGTLPDAVAEGAGTTTSYSDLADGEWWFHVRAKDGAGNWAGSAGHYRMRIDDTEAAISSLTSPTHAGESVWYPNNDPRLDWSASDTSGITGYSYVLDQSPGTTPDTLSEGTSATVTYADRADGVWYFHVRAMNGSGLWGPTTRRTLRIDVTAPGAPDITSATHPDEAQTYADDSPAVSWTTPSDLSGVSGFSYALDQTATTTPDATSEGTATSATFPDLADGVWWFHVRAKDAAGNWGTADHFKVAIDLPTPHVEPTLIVPAGQIDPEGVPVAKDGDVLTFSGAVSEGSGGPPDPAASLSCDLVVLNLGGGELSRIPVPSASCLNNAGELAGSFTPVSFGVTRGLLVLEVTASRTRGGSMDSSAPQRSESVAIDNDVPLFVDGALGCLVDSLSLCNEARSVTMELSEEVKGSFLPPDFTSSSGVVLSAQSSCTSSSYCDEVVLSLDRVIDKTNPPTISYSHAAIPGRTRPADSPGHVVTSSSVAPQDISGSEAVDIEPDFFADDPARPATELASTALGSTLIVDDNALQAFADRGADPDVNPCHDVFSDEATDKEKICDPDGREQRLAARIADLASKSTDDGMSFAPDILLLQEVRNRDAKRIAGLLNQAIELDGESCNVFDEDTRRCYGVAIATTKKQDSGAGSDDDARIASTANKVVMADTGIIYNRRTMNLTNTGRFVTTYSAREACVPKYDPLGNVIFIDEDLNGLNDCSKKRSVKLHYMARFAELGLLGTDVAVSSVHLATGSHVKSELHFDIKKRWAQKAADKLQEFSASSQLYSIAGDFNARRCVLGLRPEPVNCEEHDWWTTLTDGMGANYDDAVYVRNSTQAQMDKQYENGSDKPHTDPDDPDEIIGGTKRIDFIFIRTASGVEPTAASRNYTCGLGFNSPIPDRNTCKFLANSERYSDHLLQWALSTR